VSAADCLLVEAFSTSPEAEAMHFLMLKEIARAGRGLNNCRFFLVSPITLQFNHFYFATADFFTHDRFINYN
jgi:hypothetical protein